MSNQPLGKKGEDAASTKRPSKQYGADRECAHDECAVVLSRYNPGHYCSRHTNPRDMKSEAGDGRNTP